MFFQYISGGTLEDLIQSDQLFPWSLRIHLSMDITKGMDYLHDNHMLHRDLNSHNVLLRTFGLKYTAVVADFGLAAKTVPSVKLVDVGGERVVIVCGVWHARCQIFNFIS